MLPAPFPSSRLCLESPQASARGHGLRRSPKASEGPGRKLPLEEYIVRRIRQGGGFITFARFMELALYRQPLLQAGGGYYTAGRVLMGPGGDFVTPPELHSPYFGRGMAGVLDSLWQEMGRPRPFAIVEMGGGRGILGRDILLALKDVHPDLYQAEDYISLEISPALLARQRETLRPPEAAQDEALSGLPASFLLGSALRLPLRGVTGCFLSCELVDAFPVHRAVFTEDGLGEVYVGHEEGDFFETVGPLSDPAIGGYVEEMGLRVATGKEFCVNLLALKWLEEVARALKGGFVITFDYGFTDRAALLEGGSPPRYFGPLDRVGRFDITSDVDFQALASYGQKLGLETVALMDEVEYTKGFAHYPLGIPANPKRGRYVLVQREE